MKIFITILIILTVSLLKAQVVIENVDFKLQNYSLEIRYDLIGVGASWYVNVYYSIDNDSAWHGPLKHVIGDVNNVTAGKNKRIKWNILKEINKTWLIVDDLRILVKLSPKTGSFIDSRDSTIYKWVRIGNQVWMAENLKATKYTDGTPIKIETDNRNWCINYWHPYFCLYNNDHSNLKKYGILYNWNAATREQDSKYNPSGIQGVCPDGWHIPSDAEWEQLADYIRFYKDSDVGKHLMSKEGWKYTNGTDSLGFSALPGGQRLRWEGNFEALGVHTAWWSTEFAGGYREIWCSKKYTDYDFERENAYNEPYGFSVRCLKD